MSIDIGEIESGKVLIKVLTTNSVISTLLTDKKFQGKVIQPQSNASKLIAEHGLAILIEVDQGDMRKVFLLDTGGPKQTVVENANALGVKLEDVDKLILSHGHIDHYGGFMGVLPKLKKGCEIILSPHAYDQAIILVSKSGGQISPETLSENFRELQKQQAFKFNLKLPPLRKPLVEKLATENDLKIIEISTPMKLTNGVITSGEIEIFNENEPTKGFYLMKSRKEFAKNTFRDEISIYFNIKDKGLIVISGCGHTGIVNTIKHAQKLTGIDKIYAIIGGFHKEWEDPQDIEKTVKYIESLNPEITCGMHCTGFEFNKLMSRHSSNVLGIAGTEFHL